MKNDLSPTLLPRRQFLVLGSAAVAVAAATSLSSDIVRSVLVTEDTAPRLSVGFSDVTLEDFAKPSFAARLTSAAKLRSGDPSLDDGVRLKVHGLVRPEGAKANPVSMGMDVMYRVAGHKEDIPFMAWSHARLPHHTTASSAGAFVVPVSANQPLSLAVSSSATGTAIGGATLRGTVSLALGSGRRENKLRTGFYFVALCPAGTKTPDWASVHAVASENGKLPVLHHSTLLGSEPVSFDYIVVATSRA